MLPRGLDAGRDQGPDQVRVSIEEARRHAKQAGVDEHVTFKVAHAADTTLGDTFDVAFVFEAVHDMGRPVDVLRQIRAACTPTAR